MAAVLAMPKCVPLKRADGGSSTRAQARRRAQKCWAKPFAFMALFFNPYIYLAIFMATWPSMLVRAEAPACRRRACATRPPPPPQAPAITRLSRRHPSKAAAAAPLLPQCSLGVWGALHWAIPAYVTREPFGVPSRHVLASRCARRPHHAAGVTQGASTAVEPALSFVCVLFVLVRGWHCRVFRCSGV